MLLSDIFEQLTYGELSQLSLGGTTIVDPSNYAKLVSHINLGLADLYTRFPLSTREAVIQQYDEIGTYYLRKKYASSNDASSEPIKYIIDSIYDPFEDRVLKIEQVFDEDGQELSINDETDEHSVYTPMYDAVQVPFNDSANAMSVLYRAGHERIVVGAGFDPTLVDVDVPTACISPLLMFVASRIISPMGVEGINEGNNYLAKYEATCARLNELGMFNKDIHGNDNLRLNGWV